MNILICDDCRITRYGIIELLKDYPEKVIIQEAGNGNQTMDVLRSKHIDLVILDIAMPGKDGIGVLKDIRSEWPHLPVLMLSQHRDKTYAKISLQHGANGYLSKQYAFEELNIAISAIMNHKNYFNKEIMDDIKNAGKTERGKLTKHGLSEREYEIMIAYVLGKSRNMIAIETGVSYSSVTTFLHRAKEKLSLNNLQELVDYCRRHKLVE
jgi:two-component system, NarL family, invasion response regulator UvrY